jgi:hypothetical protein
MGKTVKDYYKNLGLDRNCTADELKKKFRELALEYHPDVSIHEKAHDIFVEINEAYQILANEAERQRYNQLYDKYIAKTATPVFNEIDIQEAIRDLIKKARQKAASEAKIRYGDYISQMDCFFNPAYKADGKPYSFFMHKSIGIAGGVGPSGSIRAKSVEIKIPRSEMAEKIHRRAMLIKSFFLAGAITLLFLKIPGLDKSLPFVLSLILLLAGGASTMLFYHITKTKSICMHARHYYLVRKYLKKGYSTGFHPFISSSPFGLAYRLFKWLV